MCNFTLPHPQLKNWHHWFHGPGAYIPGVFLVQQSNRLQNSTPKRAGQNPESISKETIYHQILARISSRYQVFMKLLWKPSEDASQKSSWNKISIPIYQLHQTASALPPIIFNVGDRGCIVRDLEILLIFVLLHSIWSPKVTPLINLDVVTPQGLCYCNFNA